MLDIRMIRNEPELVKWAAKVKGVDLDVDALLALDVEVRSLKTQVDEAQGERKRFAKEFGRADAATQEQMRKGYAEFDQRLKSLRENLAERSSQLNDLLL